jgi:hypothetical protein
MATEKGPNGLSLNIQRDYITLKTPNGNYTSSWGGAKASGKLALDGKAFRNIDTYVETERKNRPMGEVMRSLLDPNLLTSLYPNWNEEVKKNDFVKTDKVKFSKDTIFSKKYPKGGVVVDVRKKNVFIRLIDTNEVIGFDYQTLIKN